MKRAAADERGAALLSVLLLVAVMAVIAATALDRLTLGARLAGSAAAVDQGRAYGLAAEEMALARLGALAARDKNGLRLDGDWVGRDFALPLPQGMGRARVTDAGNCFNLNSLVAESAPDVFTQRGGAVMQFAALMELLGTARGEAQAVASATADYLDSDDIAAPLGAEDAAYRGVDGGYLAANRPIADKSEWRAVRGVTAALYARVAPWICVLPSTEPVMINVNTLRPEQAVLAAMLMPDAISIAQARAALAARPRGGYASSAMFWQTAPLAQLVPRRDSMMQAAVKSRWLMLEVTVELGDSVVRLRSLVDAYGGALVAGGAAGEAPPVVVNRKWGEWD